MDQTFKDKLTNWCGLVLAIAGAILAVSVAGVALPVALVTGATVAAAVAGALIGWATGKPVNPIKPPL